MRRLLFRGPASLAALLLVAPLTGCYGTIAKRTEDFSVKAAPALVETRGVYSLVEATHARRKREDAIASYDSKAFDTVKLEARFGSERDLKARTAILDLLQKYLVALGDESGGKPLADVDAPSKDAAKAITTLAKNDLPALVSAPTAAPSATATVSTTGGVTTTTTTTTTAATETNPIVSGVTSVSAGDAAEAIDVIGRVLIERKRAKALPGILESAEVPVRTLCDLLRRDIGDPQTGGLRYVLRTDYEGIETAEDAAIRDHLSDFDHHYLEKYRAIDALYALRAEQAASDAVLVQADKALDAFETTHTALVKSARQKRAPGFRALLAELTAEGEQLADMEKTMGQAPSKPLGGGK
jgi:hypothetical protein